MREPEQEDGEDIIRAVEPGSGQRRAPSAGFVGRYQLCFELASGGMGKVYLAKTAGVAGFEKLVAVKRIHPHLVDQDDFVEMFLDEARIASRIDHPNVCTVFDFGRADDDYYLAMEFLLGETVARLLGAAVRTPGLVRSERWTAAALRIAAEACEGLHAAHELRNEKHELLNVVHRDVSPLNLFVGYDGAVKLVDFGIARAADRLHVTRVGMLKGRHAYMAPEQAEAGQVDRRSDIWSLGVILFESLTGQRLFRRATETDTLMAVLRDPIPRLSEIWPDVPEDVEQVAMKALERDPDARWPTAREMGRALERCLMRLEEPCGKAELSDLMHEIFPDRYAERMRLVDEARTMRAGEVRRVLDEKLSPMGVEPVAALSRVEPRKLGRRGQHISILALIGGVVGGVAVTFGLTSALTGEPETAEAPEPGSETVTMDGTEAAEPDVPTEGTSESASAAGSGPAEPEGPEAEAPAEPTGSLEAEDTAHYEPEGPEAGAPAEPTAAPIVHVGPVEVEEPAGAGDETWASADMEEPSAETEEGEAGRKRQRARRRWRPPPRSLDPGTVSVVTPGGWADVYLGGRKIGRSPGRFELPAGRRVLVLRPFGDGDPVRVVVNVPSGGQTRVSERLAPQP